jgi:hypothetical protein
MPKARIVKIISYEFLGEEHDSNSVDYYGVLREVLEV